MALTITKDLTKYNKNDSSYRKPIDRIVIHWFGIGTLTSALNRFKSPTGGGSAHYLVSNGKIVQCVLEDEVSWHAANWEMNQRSIGIEHDATASTDANPHDLSELDYKTSAELIADIAKRYSIPLDRDHIIKHNEVAPTQCCGTVDVNKLITLAKGFLGEDPCSARVAELEEVLDGVRNSRNEWKTLSKDQEIVITTLKAEISNRTEQVGRLNDLITQKENTITQLLKNADETTIPLREEIAALEIKLGQFAKEKGALVIEVAGLEEVIKQMNSQPKQLTFKEVVDTFFGWLKGIGNGNTIGKVS